MRPWPFMARLPTPHPSPPLNPLVPLRCNAWLHSFPKKAPGHSRGRQPFPQPASSPLETAAAGQSIAMDASLLYHEKQVTFSSSLYRIHTFRRPPVSFLGNLLCAGQVASLCGVHCLNTLLQGPYFSEVDLAQVYMKHNRSYKQEHSMAG